MGVVVVHGGRQVPTLLGGRLELLKIEGSCGYMYYGSAMAVSSVTRAA